MSRYVIEESRIGWTHARHCPLLNFYANYNKIKHVLKDVWCVDFPLKFQFIFDAQSVYFLL